MGLTPVGEDPPARGHGNLLQYSCRENSMDRGARRATVTGSQRVRHDCSNWAHRHACIVPFQELLNQEHRCKKQGIGYFKVRNQLYKYSSCGKTCVSHSVKITWRKDELKLLMPITKFFQVCINKAMNLVKQNGLPRNTQGKCRDTPNQIPTSQGSDPHPQTAGSCRSPPSHPSTRPSEQGWGIPTPLEWTWCPHPRWSTVSEMKAHFTNRS